MPFWEAIPIVGKVLTGVIDLVSEGIEDKDEANRVTAQLTKVFNSADLTKFTSLLQAQVTVLVAEITGKSWLQRNWRPLLMAEFGAIILNNYILAPYITALFGVTIIMEIPPDMWALLKLGVSGYVVGRSVEKGLEIWKGRK